MSLDLRPVPPPPPRLTRETRHRLLAGSIDGLEREEARRWRIVGPVSALLVAAFMLWMVLA